MSQPQRGFRAIMPLAGIENDDKPRGIDLKDIQGDVFPSFVKQVEAFRFFVITDPAKFRTGLAQLNTNITTAQEVTKYIVKIGETRTKLGLANASREEKLQNLVPVPQINIAFSSLGMKTLGYDPSLVGDDFFNAGMGVQAVPFLGDHPVPGQATEVDWEDEFKKTIHGVVLAAAESDDTLNSTLEIVEKAIGDSINTVVILKGQLRPGNQAKHEHFGFLDGISQPALRGLAEPLPGQLECDVGTIIFGHAGDPKFKERPKWTKNGSVMAFRKLRQYVPEFNQFLQDHPAPEETWKIGGIELSNEEQVQLTGARLFGRWKSGAPLDITEFTDNPALGANKYRNNNFDYSALDPRDTNMVPGQYRCPFAAHARKMAPRKGTSLNLGDTNLDDLNVLERAMIVRTAIAYGPELTPQEIKDNVTEENRGLAFVCYQTNLKTGFAFLQHSWANATTFPMQAAAVSDVPPGFDPIIGSNEGNDRQMTGLFVNDLSKSVDMPKDFVVARGGEYFYVPSLATLSVIAAGGPLGPL